MKINKDKIKKEFRESVKREKEHINDGKVHGTTYWIINNDSLNRWAIVLGWSSGYEQDESGSLCIDKDGYCLEAKLAYQSYNSIMQCDYDVDWEMPYNPETCEVDDTSISLSFLGGKCTDIVVDWLFKQYERYGIIEEE